MLEAAQAEARAALASAEEQAATAAGDKRRCALPRFTLSLQLTAEPRDNLVFVAVPGPRLWLGEANYYEV